MSFGKALEVNGQSVSLLPRTAEHGILPGLGGYVVVPKSRTTADRVISFLETSNGGPFRLMQIGERFCKLMGLLGFGQGFTNASGMFFKAWTATILPHLPFALKDAKGAIQSLGVPEKSSEATERKYVKSVQDITTAVAACGYTAALFFSPAQAVGSAALSIAGNATAVSDVCDLQQNVADFSKARELNRQVSLLKNVAPEVQQHFVDTERVLMLKTMKAVCAVSGFVLGTGLAVMGLTSAPAWMIVATSVSLLGSLIAFGAGVYEEGMRYERTKFFSDKHIQPILPVLSAQK